MRTFTTSDDAELEGIIEQGEPYRHPKETVYILKLDEPFEVVTDGGTLSGQAGDSVGLAGRRLLLVPWDELSLYQPGEADEDDEEEGEQAAAVDHEWYAGILPGNRLVKVCRRCGKSEEINRAEWEQVRQQQKPPAQRLAAPGRNYA